MADIALTGLEEFIALGKQTHFARADRFQVNIKLPPALSEFDTSHTRNLSLLCENTTLPGKTIGARSLRINGVNEQRAHTADYGDNISFDFIVDLSWTPRRLFEKWLELCVTDVAGTDGIRGAREVGYYTDYISEVDIITLKPNLSDENPDSATYKVTLYEAWPISITSQALSYNSQTFIRLTATFVYKYWTSEAIDVAEINTDPAVTSLVEFDTDELEALVKKPQGLIARFNKRLP